MKLIKFSVLTLALCCAFFQTSQAQDMTAKNKASIQAAYDALNRKDWSAFSALCAPNFTDLNVGPAPVVGTQAAIELYKQFQSAFPDFMVKINEIVPASANRYQLRVTVTGTNTGTFMGLPATGKSIQFNDVDIVELDANGKAISHAVTNTGEALRQIGYGSMMNPNTQAVIGLYEKFGKGDVPGILEACADNVVFDLHDHMFDSKERVFKGKAEVGQFFQEVSSKFQYAKFQPVRFVADGNDVFILVEAEYKYAATGKTYASTYTHHFIIENGKVVYFRGIDDFQIMK